MLTPGSVNVGGAALGLVSAEEDQADERVQRLLARQGAARAPAPASERVSGRSS